MINWGPIWGSLLERSCCFQSILGAPGFFRTSELALRLKTLPQPILLAVKWANACLLTRALNGLRNCLANKSLKIQIPHELRTCEHGSSHDLSLPGCGVFVGICLYSTLQLDLWRSRSFKFNVMLLLTGYVGPRRRPTTVLRKKMPKIASAS